MSHFYGNSENTEKLVKLEQTQIRKFIFLPFVSCDGAACLSSSCSYAETLPLPALPCCCPPVAQVVLSELTVKRKGFALLDNSRKTASTFTSVLGNVTETKHWLSCSSHSLCFSYSSIGAQVLEIDT